MSAGVEHVGQQPECMSRVPTVEPDARIVEKRGQAEGPATVAGTSH